MNFPWGHEEAWKQMAFLFCTNPLEQSWEASSIPKCGVKDAGVGELSPKQQWEPWKTGPDLEQMWEAAGGCLSSAQSALLLCLPLFTASAPVAWASLTLFLAHISPFCLWGAFPSLGKHTAATSTSPCDLGGGERLPLRAKRGSFWGPQRKAVMVREFFKVA